MRQRFFLSLCLLALSARAAVTTEPEQLPWPASSPTDQAIFCGAQGTETSQAYSEALSRALRELTTKGATVAGAMATLRVRARCVPVAVAADPAHTPASGVSK